MKQNTYRKGPKHFQLLSGIEVPSTNISSASPNLEESKRHDKDSISCPIKQLQPQISILLGTRADARKINAQATGSEISSTGKKQLNSLPLWPALNFVMLLFLCYGSWEWILETGVYSWLS